MTRLRDAWLVLLGRKVACSRPHVSWYTVNQRSNDTFMWSPSNRSWLQHQS